MKPPDEGLEAMAIMVEMVQQIAADYRYAVEGLRQAREKIAALEAERDLYLVNEPILKELEALRELRDDVQRWRDGGGDVRDLNYVLETLEKARQE